jgi:long-chain acyl-CoA synthetase
VHPQRVETVLVNESPYIGEAVAVGSGKDFVAALVFPNFTRLREWAARNGVANDALVTHPSVRALYADELRRINRLIDVKYQRVRRAVLVEQEPSASRGEVTPSGKLVRRAVCDSYKRKLDALFMPEAGEDVIELIEVGAPAAAGAYAHAS